MMHPDRICRLRERHTRGEFVGGTPDISGNSCEREAEAAAGII